MVKSGRPLKNIYQAALRIALKIDIMVTSKKYKLSKQNKISIKK
jgi:hypothetical protein